VLRRSVVRTVPSEHGGRFTIWTINVSMMVSR
jgi:hypothetical protein